MTDPFADLRPSISDEQLARLKARARTLEGPSLREHKSLADHMAQCNHSIRRKGAAEGCAQCLLVLAETEPTVKSSHAHSPASSVY